jgi:drug/metabolite transporter (DMT)-like permease
MARGYNIGRAIGYMMLSVALIPCLNASAKYLGQSYPTIEIVWARYAGHFAYMLMMFLPRRGLRLFATANLRTHILRSALLTLATGIYFTALDYTDLPTAAVISFVSPFIVTALAGVMLGEQIGASRWTAVGVGFLGPLVILRPGLGAVQLASMLVLISATCNALYQLLTRRLAATESTETSNTYMAVVGFALTSLAVPFFFVWPQSLLDVLLFVSLGAFGGLGHYFLVRALEWAPAAVIAPFNYGQLIATVALGYAVFGEFPDIWTWLGGAIIIGSGLYMVHGERSRSAREEEAKR